MSTGGSIRFTATGLTLLGLLAASGCGGGEKLYGAPVDIEALRGRAVPLEQALSEGGEVEVVGSIGRVCDMGCWFYLMGEEEMLYVKLDLAAGLVIPTDSEGKGVLAVGEITGEGAAQELQARTVVLY